jgi:hypothetical protein
MKCYTCVLEGGDHEAVAVCIVCGKGLCMEHAIHEDIELWEGNYPFSSKRIKTKLPRILCEECRAAYSSG